MVRFFADTNNISSKEIRLSAEDTEHIRALRIRPNELFVVCDGNGTDYICHLATSQLNGNITESIAQILSRKKSSAEPYVRCTVYTAFAKGDRLDYVVQKSVELGVHNVVLYQSERCTAKPNDVIKRLERLQRISLETAKQSGRGIVPEVSSIDTFTNAVDMAVDRSDLVLLCYEEEKNLHIMTVLEHFFPPTEAVIKEPMGKPDSIAIITGPEGGFETSEIKLAQSKDVSVVSMGPRVLRCETAPIVALAAIMYHTGNL